jgi:general secretion pathway protein I
MSDLHPERTADGGFTITEALVALFVFAMAGVALVQMQTQSVSTFTRVENRTLAGLVAENRLVEEMAKAEMPVIGAREGKIEMAARVWRWKLDVSPTSETSTLRLEVKAYEADATEPAATLVGFRMTGSR